ncbi:MCE family protein [Mycobacterium sp. IS-3022]|uniref:MCE family protein n=1 Tax=Mycobacterium sp. IS-3022 TaxID=1772277 RepID=UPI0007417E0E|nr:MCE family protein [Mycobacterium sp. IS-3022]KUI04793.1 mammalian cell entry protein [Mycobacterium sp. IS-3022]
MIKYRESNLVRAGILGAVLIVLIIAVGLQPERIMNWATDIRYQALFAEAGGLTPGNEVKVSGVKVGSVTGVSLQRGKALVDFTVDSAVVLGAETTAHIRTGTLLGERILTLDSAGTGSMAAMDVIPVSRTASPYSLSEAVGDLTTNTAGTDLGSLNHSLDTLTATIDQIAPQLGPMFDGLSRLSKSINSRNDTVANLLESTGAVTKILADRSQQVNQLILNANDLLAVLVQRRHAIVALLNSTSALAQQLSGIIADNEQALAPTLEKLNTVMAVLERNRDNIAKGLPGLNKYLSTLSEIVSNGPYYTAFVPNLIPGQFTQPFLDYLFGFRRGTNAGQPPDNAGPRAELPFPYNGIPLEPR